MPKRKRSKKDYDEISYQIKKLKKKLKRARHRDHSLSSSSASESEQPTNNHEVGLDDSYDRGVDDTFNFQELVEVPPVTVDQQPATCFQSPDLENDLSASDNKQDETTDLDKDILDILGDDPSITVQYGPEIHKELANRLQHIATSGLTKETRKELQLKYLLPSNGVLLGAPSMNPEIKAALPETLSNRDKALETKQKLLGSAISCLTLVISQLMGSNHKDKETLKKLMDANKILCDIQHSDSVTRRMFSTSVLKKDVKSQILDSKIDKLLFGENLPDTLKAAKAVSKSSAEIKGTANNNPGKKSKPATPKSNNLNSKPPAGSTRKPPANMQQKTKPTSFHQNQHAKSSKTSSQQQKPYNSRR